MAFPPPTYILQQQAGQQQNLPHLGVSYQHPFFMPSQDLPTATEVQILKQQLDISLKKNHEYEKTILHLATLSRPRSQNSIMCSDCKQQVAHACSFGGRMIPNSTSALELSSSHVQPPGSSSFSTFTTSHSTDSYPGLQTQVAGLLPTEGNLNEHLAAHAASPSFYSIPSLPLRSSDISSISASHSTNPDPYPSGPRLAVTQASRVTTSYPPLGQSIATHSRDNSFYDNSMLGKRHLPHIDPECEPGKKRVKQNLLEETSMHCEFQPSQCLAPSSRYHPSFNDSFPPLPATLSLPTEGGGITSELESRADWTIAYSNKVERELDATLIYSSNIEAEYSITCVKFSNDGKYLAVEDKRATRIYDVQTGEKTCTLRDITSECDDPEHFNCALCFSPNNLYLAVGEMDNYVRIWEVSKKRVRSVLKLSSDQGSVDWINFSPDGRLIATGAFDCKLEIWNWRDGSRKVFQGSVDRICFSQDGKYIVGVVGISRILVWRVRTGRLVRKLKGHCGWVTSLAFMPDGTRLMSGSLDRTVKLWDLGLLGMGGSGWQDDSDKIEAEDITGKELLNFRGDPSVYFVAVSSNGRWVVACSLTEVYIWNSDNTQLHRVLKGPKYMYPIVDFNPVSGCLALRVSTASQVLLWRFDRLSEP